MMIIVMMNMMLATVGVVRVHALIVLLDTSVGKVRGGVQVWKHGALNARLHYEQVMRGQVERGAAGQPPPLLRVECPVDSLCVSRNRRAICVDAVRFGIFAAALAPKQLRGDNL